MSPRREPEPKRRRLETNVSSNNTISSSPTSPGSLQPPQPPAVQVISQSPTPGFPQDRTYVASNPSQTLSSAPPMHLSALLETLVFPSARSEVPASPERSGAQVEEESPIPLSPEPESQLDWHPVYAYEDNGAYFVGPAPPASAIVSLREAVLETIGADGWLDEVNRASLEHHLGVEPNALNDLKLVSTAAEAFRQQQRSGHEPTGDFRVQFYDAMENLGTSALLNGNVAYALDEFTNARPALPHAAQNCIDLYNQWHDGDEDVPHISTFPQFSPIYKNLAKEVEEFESLQGSEPSVDESIASLSHSQPT
jgi:hypothetical protein